MSANLFLPWTVDEDTACDAHSDEAHVVISDCDGGVAALVPFSQEYPGGEAEARRFAAAICAGVNREARQ